MNIIKPFVINHSTPFIVKDLVAKSLFDDGFFYAQTDSTLPPHETYLNLINSFTIRKANDASRRPSHTSKLSNMTNVDMDYPAVGLHSEASFSPSSPQLISLYCFAIDPLLQTTGLTTLVDGQALWKSLSLDYRLIFQSTLIEYTLSISMPKPVKGKGIKPWYLDEIGVSNCSLDLEKQRINFTFRTFAANDSALNGLISFANHLFIDLNTEPQIITRRLGSLTSSTQNNILHNIQVNSINHNLQYISWQPNQFIIIDNNRMMHGRTAYDMNLLRDIGIIQIASSRFS